MVSAVDLYFIADNDGDSTDVPLMTQAITVVPTKGFSVKTKIKLLFQFIILIKKESNL